MSIINISIIGHNEMYCDDMVIYCDDDDDYGYGDHDDDDCGYDYDGYDYVYDD